MKNQSTNKIFYMKHNVGENYFNADAAGDTQMKKDILLSELSKLILQRPIEVQAALFKHFPTSTLFSPGNTITSKALVGYVSDGLNNSRDFTSTIADMIVGGNKYSADAKTPTPSTIDYNKALNDTSNIVSGFGSLFGGKKKAKAASAAQASQSQKDADAAKAALLAQVEAMKKGKNATSNIGKYLLISLGVAVVVSAIGYGIYKYKTK